MSRIRVELDPPFTQIQGSGWGTTNAAGGIQFAASSSKHPPEGEDPPPSQFVSVPDALWKVPGLGVITLKPRFLKYGAEKDGYVEGEFVVAENSGGGAALRGYRPNPDPNVLAFVRTRRDPGG
ncbi:hypothetical protein EON81_23735, partial [bacterium]